MEKFELLGSDFYINECKLTLAKIYSQLDDMNSVDKAEDLYNQVINRHEEMFANLNEKILNAKSDLVKFYLKQEKYDVR